MEAACTSAEVVAIQDDNGQMTIIHINAPTTAHADLTTVATDSTIVVTEPTTVATDPTTDTTTAVVHPAACSTTSSDVNMHVTAHMPSKPQVDAGAQPQDGQHVTTSTLPPLTGDQSKQPEQMEMVDKGVKQEVLMVELLDVKNEVSIQANDYDIERATGILPARKRFIPLKYRDFRSADDIVKEDDQDSDYEPEPLNQVKETKKKRGRGRPRKCPEGTSESEGGGGEVKKPLMARTANGYKCLTCNHVFTQKGNLKVHLLTHTNQRPWQCDIDNCDKGFRTKESLRRHKLSHMGIKPYECQECKRKFCSAFSLQEHMSLHKNERPYTCSHCQRAFRQISCLRRHLLTHSSDMPHACEVCGRCFSQAVYLRSHMKVHTGEKPFSCDQCNKSFAHASDLTRHKIIHSGSKPYSCSVCSMRFSDPSSRRRHEREHVGTKAYTCELCSEGFKRASQLRAHLYRRHGGGGKEGVELQVQDGTEPVCYHIELRNAEGEGSVVTTGKVVDVSSLDQKKILSLIHNLNKNIVVQEVQVASDAAASAGESARVVSLEGEEGGDVNQVVLPIEVSDAMEKGDEEGGSVVTIAQLEVDEMPQDLPSTCHMVQEGEGEAQPIFEVHYQPTPPTQTSISKTITSIPSETTTSASLPQHSHTSVGAETLSAAESDASCAGTDPAGDPTTSTTPVTSVCINSPFVSGPDFGSQDYYDWLSGFTEVCRLLPVPLEVELFRKISQVHKSLSDFMASPSGVIADKDNFRILMSISKDLRHILDEHLKCMLQNLSETK